MEKYQESQHTIYVKPGLWKRLRLYAFNNGTSISKIFCEYAEKFLPKEEK